MTDDTLCTLGAGVLLIHVDPVQGARYLAE
jgi:hypothetical protein